MRLRPTHEVLREAVDKAGVKKIARALDVSASLVYKWCQPPKAGPTPDASGANNPLDRLLAIVRLADDLDVIHYLCRHAGGYFTLNPPVRGGLELKFVTETVEILNKFADLMHFAERSLHNDGRVNTEEATKLRRDWDRLKSRLERFIACCERGEFDFKRERMAKKKATTSTANIKKGSSRRRSEKKVRNPVGETP